MSLSTSVQVNNNKITYDLGIMNDHIKNILVTISQNPVTNVISQSGTGKTTRLPIGIAEAGNRIMVVVSDPAVASSLGTYVKDLTGVTVSNNITSADQIKYVSEGDIKEHIYRIVREGKCLDLDFADILMIDQADIGSLDQFLIMALWRYCATNRARVPRLLLVSNRPIQSDQFEIKPYTIHTNYYPVEIRYSGHNYPIQGDSTKLLKDVANLIYDLHTSSLTGDMILFTTGKLQIESLIQLLESLQMENVNIYPAHSNLTRGEVDRIYRPTNERKIIVADKLAETTFTLDNLEVIIDLMMDHRKELSLTGGQRYPKRYVTQAQANLRSGRGGRFGPVLSYRMMTQDLFNRLVNQVEPEIYRVPLHGIMLELIENGIDPFQVLDMFDSDNLNKLYSLLLRLRLINTNGKITEGGKFVMIIPYGLRQGVILYNWLQHEYPPYPAIAILSMIDALGKSYYVYPLRDEDTSHAEHNIELLEHTKQYFEPFSGQSDVHTYGHIWTTMMDEVGGDEALSSDVKDWCHDNYIRYENISEVISLNQVVINILNQNRSIDIEAGPFDSNNLIDMMGPILTDVYHDKRLILDTSDNNVVRVRYLDPENNYYKIDRGYSITTIEMDRPQIIFGLITSTISSKYTSDFNTILCSLTR